MRLRRDHQQDTDTESLITTYDLRILKATGVANYGEHENSALNGAAWGKSSRLTASV